ncbi:MAG TPA: NAD-dependent epimerase/dehydratase family protein [Solirubrobacterales bacterium]|jgi:nucleoside-diphosphate-sugar epimerase|nr:NAD-dependent epimerase/dehydratase family protein [Solirubrobacterales bacterium]
MESGTTVLVTGGAGFIGSHLVDRLLNEGCDVRVLDNFATGHRANLAGTIEDIDLVEGDMQSYERCHNAVRGCEVVFHVGALPSVPRSIQDPLTSTNANVIATLNILLASRDEGVRRVVYSSSSSVYGANETLPKHEDLQPLPIAPYAVSKLAGEGYCRSFTQVYGLETVALRYFNVFGPRQDPFSQYSAVMPLFISAFLEDRRPLVYGDGEQSRDFTYIGNAVEANVLAARGASGAVAGQRFNIACGEHISLNRILGRLRELSGKEIEAVYRDPRPGDIRHSLADVSHAQESLGYEPSVDALEGVGRAYEHYRECHEAG